MKSYFQSRRRLSNIQWPPLFASRSNASRPRRRSVHRGVAACEFAIVIIPILILFAGTVEVYTTVLLRQALVVSAYEGARVAAQRKSVNANVISRARAILDDRNISYDGDNAFDIDVYDEPVLGGPLTRISGNVQDARVLKPITITVTAPTDGNTVFPLDWFTWFRDRELSASVTIRKEFSDVPEPPPGP